MFGIILLILLILISFLAIRWWVNKQNNEKMLVKLWVEHLFYTRMVFMSFFRDLPELETMKVRLIQNQNDIGAFIGSMYGKEIGNKVAKLLIDHILIAVDILTSIKTKNDKQKAVNITGFYNNADEIGIYLDNLTGKNIFRHHMKMHIDTLINSIVSFNSNNHSEDIKYTDQYLRAGIDMAFDMA